MNFMTHALQGSTTFVSILIGQVLVVSSLSMMTIWLMVRRARLGAMKENSAENSGANLSNPAVQVSVTTAPEYLELEQQLVAAQKEQTKLATMKEQYTALEEKVKFLESKLLEYEILQEEIGTLSLLKIENEKLKKEISKLQKEIERRVGGGKGAAEAVPEVPVMPAAPTPEVVEQALEPAALGGLDPGIAALAISDEISAEDLANLATVSFAPEPEVASPVSQPDTSAMTAAPNPDAIPDLGGDLDGLLSEIDKLTSDSNPPKS